ncbi:hypothetical protein J6590_080426 [Homalodisca vitripennis]|nr:hypothetical protein J6590_080426 [Homalodisca vitripennis]
MDEETSSLCTTLLETIWMSRRQICGRLPCVESDSSFREYKDKKGFQQLQPQICGRLPCVESESRFREYEDESGFQQQQPRSYNFRTILPHEDPSREVYIYSVKIRYTKETISLSELKNFFV